MTERQWQCLRLFREGMTQQEIGQILGISQPRVCQHLQAVRRQAHGIHHRRHRGRLQETPCDPHDFEGLDPRKVRAVL
jgi:predicted transcriptional regulator